MLPLGTDDQILFDPRVRDAEPTVFVLLLANSLLLKVDLELLAHNVRFAIFFHARLRAFFCHKLNYDIRLGSLAATSSLGVGRYVLLVLLLATILLAREEEYFLHLAELT
jgi:hypothetical protein